MRHFMDRLIIVSESLEFKVALLLCLLSFLSFSNCLHNGFLMDDYPMLIENTRWGDREFLQLGIEAEKSQAYFRPLTHMLNAIGFGFFGLNTVAYHLFSLMFYYLAAVTLFELVRKIFSALIDNSFVIGLGVALLFIIHPINGALVNYKNATAWPFMIMCMNLSLLSLFRYPLNELTKADYALSLLWFLLSLLCHEVAVVLPGYVFLISYGFLRRPFLSSIKQTWPHIVMLGSYLVFRQGILKLQFNPLSEIDHFSLREHVLNLFELVGWYMRQLIFPDQVVLAFELAERRLAVNFIFWIGLAIVIIFLMIKKRTFSRAVMLSFFWMFLGVSPVAVASLSRPLLGVVIEPHWVIFSSIGFFMLVMVAGYRIFMFQQQSHESKFLKKLFGVIVLSGFVFLFGMTRYYNFLWSNQTTYCQYWLSLCPNNYWPHFWLGFESMGKNDELNAEKHFKAIINKGVKSYATYGNLGIIEYNRANYYQALDYFQKALSFNPQLAQTHESIGSTLTKLNEFGMASKAFKAAIRLDPYLINSYEGLIDIYRQQNKLDQMHQVQTTLDQLKNLKTIKDKQ